MDFFYFLIASILSVLTITSERIKLSIQIFLSGITGYWLYRKYNPNVYMLDFSQYNLNTVTDFFASGRAIISLIILSAMYGVFYCVLRLLIFNLLHNPLEKYYQRKANQLSKEDKRSATYIAIKTMRYIVRKLKTRGLLPLNNALPELNEVDLIRDVTSSVYSLTCLFIHITVCCFIFKIPTHIIIYIIALLIFLLIVAVLLIPALKVISFLLKHAWHEFELAKNHL